jgi:uncharacterized 2Fe-2S/4Fe-4S cluster protein (DUF4445 family)
LSENRKCLVIFQPSGRRGYIEIGKSIKEASVALGVDIEGVCGEKAICGKCRVRVEEGFFEKYGAKSSRDHLSPMGEAERAFFSLHEEQNGFRLACQARLLGDAVIFVPEESRLGKQVIRKKTAEKVVDLKPAVKKYYVELPQATLDDPLGDWERLQAELSKGYGLTDLTIDYQVLTTLQETIRRGDWKVTTSIWQNKEIIKVEPGESEKAYGLAVDIGTTTVAAYLCDLCTSSTIATASMMNPQVIYGEDVMSRITYAMTHQEGLDQMNEAIITGLNGLIEDAATQASIRRHDIVDMTIVGNTCMHHIFLNINPVYIGKAPFTPARHHSIDVKACDIRLMIAPGAYVHVLPIEAGFVGADNVGVIIAEEPHRQDSIELLIDIGTNGELVLGNRQKIISSSCATGPALEGAEIKFGMRAAPGAIEKIVIDPKTLEVYFKVIGCEKWNSELTSIGAKGICGSGIIDVVPQMFLAGIIDRSGRFRQNLQTPRLRKDNEEACFVIAWANETSIGQDIVFYQSDLRAVQLAKGAMYAGAKIMMRTLGVEKLDKVILAGAFGSYIDKTSAALLGLFPDCELDNIYSVGNAAGEGARLALLNTDKRQEADQIARQVEYIELTLAPDFDKIFAQAMWIPHMKDKFPHLDHLLQKNKQEDNAKI